MRDLTLHYASQFGGIWRLDKIKSEFLEDILTSIFSFEIQIERIECEFKLSQNRSFEDKVGILNELNKSKNLAAKTVADFMAMIDQES